jgi:chromosome segregation ATPase
MSERDEIIASIEKLRAEVAELEANIPAHSTSISHITQIEELEDEIEVLERELASLN